MDIGFCLLWRREINWPVRELGHSSLFIAEVKKAWILTSAALYFFVTLR
jgi:hypothetical protein